LGDLLGYVGKRYTGKMPEQLRDTEKNALVRSLWAVRVKEKIQKANEILKNGEVV